MTTYGVDRSGGSTGSATVPAVDSIVWNDVVFLTFADSPYTLDDDDRGKLFVVDCSGGAVSITLPTIAGLSDFPDQTWLVGIKKSEASANAVTINRASTDTIDSATSKTLVSLNAGCTLVPDTDPSPDQWVVMDWGPSGGNYTVDSFSGDASDTTFELSTAPGAEENTFVFISGVYQQKSEYSVSGTTLTFSAAPPTGTNNIQVVIGATLAIGTPSDGTVGITTLADSGLALGQSIINGYLSWSVSGSVLTVALKTLAGTDPSAADPVKIVFRSVTATDGAPVVRSVTAATSIAINDTATLGTTNSIAFRLWAVAFDDGGTVRLGLINCRSSLNVYPLAGWGIASATAEDNASDSAHVFYAGAAVSSKAYATLGYGTWESGLATAGTWSAAPTRAQLFGLGVSLPGQLVQAQRTETGAATTGTTVIPADDTIPQITEGDEYLSQAITPVSAANLLHVSAQLWLSNNVVGPHNIMAALFQDSTANALVSTIQTNHAASYQCSMWLSHRKLAGTTSALTMRVRAGGGNPGTTGINGLPGNRIHGGVANSFLEVQEIMA
jgi:hypothetical protein